MTHVSLLGNEMGLDVASVITSVFKQHTSLKTICGFDEEVTDLSHEGLKQADAMLIAADLEVDGR